MLSGYEWHAHARRRAISELSSSFGAHSSGAAPLHPNIPQLRTSCYGLRILAAFRPIESAAGLWRFCSGGPNNETLHE